MSNDWAGLYICVCVCYYCPTSVVGLYRSTSPCINQNHNYLVMVIKIYFSLIYPVLSSLPSLSPFLSFTLTTTPAPSLTPSLPIPLSPSPYSHSRVLSLSSLPPPPPSLSCQDWLTPENKQWPGSGRANEVQGDREVIATRYQVLISPSKKTAPTKPMKK